MAKTHLPAHMDSVRQKLRPKHQLLILKCYPRLPKNSAADVKPNSSELSYLLYYAATRRSKLQKVGAFLERKTASDVSKQQSARVLVTLQILSALLENKAVGEGSALALTAPYVMRIIHCIIRETTDIGLIEATQKTWDIFCRHQDQAVLAADRDHTELYGHIVAGYAAFAHKTGRKKLGKAMTPVAVQDAIRLREAGLHAIRSVLDSDLLAFESCSPLLNVIVPAILSNLRGGDAMYLERLVHLSKKTEDDEKDKAMNRRLSMAVSRTHTSIDTDAREADPRAAEGTAQDADKLAEEGVALLALDCLKATFSTENRLQVRFATTAMLNHLHSRPGSPQPETTRSEKPGTPPPNESWAIKLFELCTAWTLVQDRFILLVTLVETMIRLPLMDADLDQHLLYTNLIDNVLRSDLNLIGLSIMDVLLGLIQQTLRVLQLGGFPATASSPAASHNDDLNLTPPALSSTASPVDCVRLLSRLKACIADLATHVYYTSQISDMIGALLFRLKPNPTPNGLQSPTATAAAIEEPKSAVNDVASNASVTSRGLSHSTNSLFSFDTARRVALEIVDDILRVANSTRWHHPSAVPEGRHPVHISIWEGTQWLLRDPSLPVRAAYVTALITWLELETKKSDFCLSEQKQRQQKIPTEAQAADSALARKAVGNLSATKDRAVDGHPKKVLSAQTFLPLLHLAIYENALQFAASSPQDIILISRLLAKLVQKLGVNATASGLPMVLALQDEIRSVDSSIGKVRIGSLVHGYLWALVKVFGLEHTVPGKAIRQEITRREQKGIWVQEIQYLPLSLETNEPVIGHPPSADTSTSAVSVTDEDLRSFQSHEALADSILDSYQRTVTSPPPSVPNFPGRGANYSVMERSSSYLATKQPTHDQKVIANVRDAMISKWSREECLAAVAAMAPRSVSLSGSQSSPQNGQPLTIQALTAATGAGNHRQLLAAVNGNNGSTPPRNNSRLQSRSSGRRHSGSLAGKVSSSAAGKSPGIRVEELKTALANGAFTALTSGTAARRGYADNSSTIESSDSMVEVDDDLTVSDEGFMSRSKRDGRAKLDVNQLLATINVDDGGVKRVGMTAPPY